jgi:hypothetical protein
MVEEWNIAQEKVKIVQMFSLYHHSPILQHSTTPLLHCTVKAKGDWGNKDIAILIPYYT